MIPSFSESFIFKYFIYMNGYFCFSSKNMDEKEELKKISLIFQVMFHLNIGLYAQLNH